MLKTVKTNSTRVAIAQIRIKLAIHPQRLSPSGRGSDIRAHIRPPIGVRSRERINVQPKPNLRLAPNIPTRIEKSEPDSTTNIISNIAIAFFIV